MEHTELNQLPSTVIVHHTLINDFHSSWQRFSRLWRLGFLIFLVASFLVGIVTISGSAKPSSLPVHCLICFADPTIIDNTNSLGYSVSAGDIDDDGDMDVLATSLTDDIVAWYENNNGLGSDWSKTVITTNGDWPASVEPADIDGDNHLDVFIASQNDNTLAWYENTNGDGSSWSEHVITTTAMGAVMVSPGDIDEDNDIDFAAATPNDDTFAWYENLDGIGASWERHVLYNTADGASAVNVSDINGDGHLDVVAGSYDEGALYWFSNDSGDGSTWTTHYIAGYAPGVRTARGVDIDQDGYMDVLVTYQLNNSVSWHRNRDGTGTSWWEYTIVSSFSNAWGADAADFDEDGDLDVVATSAWGHVVYWFTNNGNGNTWTAHTLTTDVNQPYLIRTVDLDGDSDKDILYNTGGDHKLAKIMNNSGHIQLVGYDTAPTSMVSGERNDLLKLTATHMGTSGDADVELVSLALIFEESAGDPLSTSEANALVKNLFIYLDDGSGTFEVGSDQLVTTVSDLSLVDGVQMVPFADNDAVVAIPYGTPRTYFVVIEASDEAVAQTPGQLRVVHKGQYGTQVENRSNDAPLRVACPTNDASSAVRFEVADTDTALEGSFNPSDPGDTAYFTATVSVEAPAGGYPTGNVSFTVDEESPVLRAVSNGVAVLARSDLTPGNHSIQAEYSGHGGYEGSGSDILHHYVRYGMNVVLESSTNPQMVGESVTFTATLSSSGGVPGMEVTFKDGDTVLGSDTPEGGIATLTLSSLALGEHNIIAYYPGDENIADGVSNLIVQKIITAIYLPLALR